MNVEEQQLNVLDDLLNRALSKIKAKKIRYLGLSDPTIDEEEQQFQLYSVLVEEDVVTKCVTALLLADETLDELMTARGQAVLYAEVAEELSEQLLTMEGVSNAQP